MNRSISLFFMSLTLLAGAAFAGDVSATVTSQDIIGHKFYLESVDGEAFAGDRRPFIEFSDDLTFHGAVCNNFRGTGTLVDGVFTSGPILSTRLLCPDGGLSDLESRFFNLLELGFKLTLDNGILTMKDEDGDTELVFVTEAGEVVKAEDLEGRTFMLKKVDGEDFQVSAPRYPFVRFGHDYLMTGTICNNFYAPAKMVDGKLVSENAASTMMLCLDERLNQLEAAFHEALRNGLAVELSGSTLTLRGAGTVLVFEAK